LNEVIILKKILVKVQNDLSFRPEVLEQQPTKTTKHEIV